MDALAQLSASLAGKYTIEREIGRGGMATVYLARDVRHNRNVALKVLNPELGAVLGVERFLSEIQVTANLQHPNLLPLFDSGEADGLLFYVMPYVEGESLRGTLQREKQLPIDEAIHIATAVASALDYAHRRGVIHRDLKPENILLHEGQPVVADFGIALAVSNAGGNRITQTGLSLGTPQYMSPEQATGDREIDGRTDVYSLGAVLYEMLAGEPPHDGKTSQAIIAKVLTDKPRSIRLSRDTVAPHVEAAVERALAKLPADRFHSAHEFADALLGKSVVVPAGATTPGFSASLSARGTRTRQIMRWTPWMIAAVALGVAAVALLRGSQAKVSGHALRYEVRLPSTNTLAVAQGSNVAIAPGGRAIAYVATSEKGDRRVFVKLSEELQPREIPGSEGGRWPFFSPDGNWVGFHASGQLKKALVLGGFPTAIVDVPAPTRASWSPSGRIVFAADGRLATVPATGGASTFFLPLPDSVHGETAQVSPVALDDGKTVLYSANAMGGSNAARIAIASLDGGAQTILPVQGSFALGVLDGYLLYTTSAGGVMAVRFDVRRRKIDGVPIPVIDQVAVETGNPASYVDLAADGSIAYVSGVTRRRMVLAQGDGNSRVLPIEVASYNSPRFSPDGRRIAVTVSTQARSDIWIYDLPSGPLTRLTNEGSNDRPEWTPDGRSVLFRSNRSGLNATWIQPVDGTGVARLLFGEPNAKIDEAVMSPDGRGLLFQRDRVGRGELWFRSMTGDTTPKQIGTGAFGEVGGRFSPDGRWVAFSSSESGTSQVYVRPMDAAMRYQISLEGGSTPLWAPDGRRVFYQADRQIIAATIGSFAPFTIASRTPVLTSVFAFNGIHADYDVMKDGRTFVAFQPADQDARLVAVQNWRAELRSRIQGIAP